MFQRHMGTVYSVTFSPDGRSLVSGSNSVCVWNIRDGSSVTLPATQDAGFVFSVVFSPDGRYIAAGDLKNWLWIWDSRTHKLVANWKGHTDCVWCVKFTPDGRGLMSGGTDQTVKYWDVSSLGILEDVSRRGREVVASGQSFPLIRSFSGHAVSLYMIFLLVHNVDSILRAVSTLLRFSLVTVNWLLLVQKIRACGYGICELAFGS